LAIRAAEQAPSAPEGNQLNPNCEGHLRVRSNGRKFVEANLKLSQLISQWLFKLSSLQKRDQSDAQATIVELDT
jgi:hypothetical protein